MVAKAAPSACLADAADSLALTAASRRLVINARLIKTGLERFIKLNWTNGSFVWHDVHIANLVLLVLRISSLYVFGGISKAEVAPMQKSVSHNFNLHRELHVHDQTHYGRDQMPQLRRQSTHPGRGCGNRRSSDLCGLRNFFQLQGGSRQDFERSQKYAFGHRAEYAQVSSEARRLDAVLVKHQLKFVLLRCSCHCLSGLYEFRPDFFPVVGSKVLASNETICSLFKRHTVFRTWSSVCISVLPLPQLSITLSPNAVSQISNGHGIWARKVFIEVHNPYSIAIATLCQ